MRQVASVVLGEDSFLLRIASDGTAPSVSSWFVDNRAELDAQLLRSGALLFRGFGVDRDEFARFADAVSPTLVPYTGGATPRSEVSPNIFTSTEAAPNVILAQHSEMSYLPQWPRKVLFFCEVAAKTGGQTTLCDNRRLTQRLDPAWLDEIERRGLLYLRNYRSGSALFRDWPTVFGTTDRSVVEDGLRRMNIRFEWYGDDRLRTFTAAQGVTQHTETGERLWFNHIAVLHSATFRGATKINPFTKRPSVTEEEWAVMDPDRIPPLERMHEVFYGDGAPIPDEHVAALIKVLKQETITFRWEAGDVLLLDNLLALHGRNAYTGDRRVLAALRDPSRGASSQQKELA